MFHSHHYFQNKSSYFPLYLPVEVEGRAVDMETSELRWSQRDPSSCRQDLEAGYRPVHQVCIKLISYTYHFSLGNFNLQPDRHYTQTYFL